MCLHVRQHQAQSCIGMQAHRFCKGCCECISLAVWCEIKSINSSAHPHANLDGRAQRGKDISSYLREKKNINLFLLIISVKMTWHKIRREDICGAGWFDCPILDHTSNSNVLDHILCEGWVSSVVTWKLQNPAGFKEIKGRHYLVYGLLFGDADSLTFGVGLIGISFAAIVPHCADVFIYIQ